MKRLSNILSLSLILSFLSTGLTQGGTLIGAFDVGPGGCTAAPCIPYYANAGHTWLSKIWSPLVSLNEDVSGLAPQLATEWSSNEDATLWTFELREGVTWHDGEPFTAEDVKFSIELALHPDAATRVGSIFLPPERLVGGKAFAAGEAEGISGVRIVDAQTIEIETTEPAPRLPGQMIELYILPQHALADLGPANLNTSDWFITQAIGTGPFEHSEYRQDEAWTLVPNEDYWNGAPRLDRLINRYFVDETAAVLALEGGEIGFTYVSGDVAQGMDEEGFTLYQGPSGVTNYLIFNYRDPIFTDERVRKAILHAIDREAIVEALYNGQAEVQPCINPWPSMKPDASRLNDYAYDPDTARGLLDEAGYDGGLNVEVVTYYDSQQAADVLAAIQQYLAEVDIGATPLVDKEGYDSYFYTGENWDVSYRGLGMTPFNYPFNFYVAGGQPTTDGAPLIGETFPELVDLINAAQVERDSDRYLELLQDICAFQNEHAIEGYMWVTQRFGVADDDLAEFYWYPAPGGGPYEDHAETWSVN